MILVLDHDDFAVRDMVQHLQVAHGESLPLAWADEADAETFERATQVLLRRTRLDSKLASRLPALQRVVVFGQRRWLVEPDVDIVTVRRPTLRRAAEHTLYLLLIAGHERADARMDITDAVRPVDPGSLRQHTHGVLFQSAPAQPVRHVSELRVGLVGAGELALELIPMLRGLGASVRYWARTSLPRAAELALGIEAAGSLAELLAASDAVVLLVGPTPMPVLGTEELAHMPHGALLVNVARPGAWDAAAVLRAREAGRLSGVATDVLGPGLSSDELKRFVTKCCVTPLVAGGGPGRLVDEFDRVGAALLAPF